MGQYAETAEMPFRLDWQVRILKRHLSPAGLIDDTMREIIGIVHEWYEVYDATQKTEDFRVEAMCEKLVEDHNQGKETWELLRTVPGPVLTALLDGTFAHKYVTDASFREMFLPMSSSAGIYLNSFVVKKTQKGLTLKQWQKVKALMETYLKGEGNVIDPKNATADERKMIKVAAAIERARDKELRKPSVYLEDAYQGKRTMVQKKGVAQQYCDMIAKRIRPDLDPTGEVPQLQIPVQIGCSKNLLTRTAVYPPDGANGMKGAPLTWQLLMCCLTVLKIDIVHICVPILIIWKAEHLKLGEILITICAGSMVSWGGLNPTAPGTTSMNEATNFRKEMVKAFVDNKWTRKNMESSMKTVAERLEMTSMFRKLQEPIGPITEMVELIDEIKELNTRARRAEEKLREKAEVIAERTKILEASNNKLADAATKLADAAGERQAQKQSYLQFGKDVLDWVKKGKEEKAKSVQETVKKEETDEEFCVRSIEDVFNWVDKDTPEAIQEQAEKEEAAELQK